MTDKAEEHPAQQVYVKIRRKASRVSPDPVLLDLLGFGLLWAEIETLSQGEFDVVCELLKAGDETFLQSVYLPSGLLSKRALLRRLHAQGLEQSLVHEVKRNIKLCSAIERCLHTCTTLTNLDLFAMTITKQGARHLAKGLKASTSLLNLSFKQAKCGDAVFPALAHGIGLCCSLQEVSISGCDLTDESAGRVCDIIRSHCKRRNDARWTTSLRDVQVTVRDIDTEIASSGLLVLDLSDNLFTSKSAASFARVLENDTWIGAINLGYNKISGKGMEQLLETLQGSNEWLSILDLRGNPASSVVEQIDELVKARAFEKTLQLLVSKDPKKEETSSPAAVVANAAVSWKCGHQLTSVTANTIGQLVAESEERLDVPTLYEMATVLRSKTARKRRGVRVKRRGAGTEIPARSLAAQRTEDQESSLALVEASIEQLQSYVSNLDVNSPTATSEANFADTDEVVTRLRNMIATDNTAE